MKGFHQLLIVSLSVLALFVASMLGHAQGPRDSLPVTPSVLSGADIGFRVDALRHGSVSGRFVVRINGSWVDVDSSFAARPLTQTR